MFIKKKLIFKSVFTMLFSQVFLLFACNQFWGCYCVFSWQSDVKSQKYFQNTTNLSFLRALLCHNLCTNFTLLVFFLFNINTRGNSACQCLCMLTQFKLATKKNQKNLYALVNMYVLFLKYHNICGFGKNALEIHLYQFIYIIFIYIKLKYVTLED